VSVRFGPEFWVKHNGPAIEVVFVAESNGGGDLHPGYEDKSTKAVMSEAWRNFCLPGTSLNRRWSYRVNDPDRRRSIRGTKLYVTSFDSRYRFKVETTGAAKALKCSLTLPSLLTSIFMESICGYPGTRTERILIASRVRFIDQSQKRRKAFGPILNLRFLPSKKP
jgi:hypothetical protein